MTAKTESLMAADDNYCLIVSRFQYQRKINVHLKDPSNLEFTFNIPNGTISATWGGGGTPYNGLYVEALPKRGTFFRLEVYKRVGI